MKVRLDFECGNGHRTEKVVEGGTDRIRCPQCKKWAPILWLAPRSPHQQFSTPVVFWRYQDGKLGVAGSATARTPKNADRVEARNMAEYRQLTKQLNHQWAGKESRKEEVYREHLERQESERRGRLTWAMGQESDPAAREIYRAALEHKREDQVDRREYFSEGIENEGRRR